MVKKKGKDRQDKYYYLAKETGYRARSAFKLIQLNKKYNFLQSSQVLVDLCAAPGGWLQVASEHMPMSSVVVGVDLVPIRPIPRCITFQDDITKESCYTQIKQELRQWKADCFLHDGAPNIGKNWLQDAFTQSALTLSALKLASDFLRKGGWFITKLFRSKDYQSLMWVFGQLFKKVHATKPQASRSESAEMFVVCEGYKCPDKVDKKFFDPRAVFEDVESDQKKVRLADFKAKKKKKAVGYDDNHGLLFKTRKVSEYLQSDSPLTILSETNVLEFDNEDMKNDPLVINDIIEMVKDLKSLARREIKKLLRWHEKYQVRVQRQEKSKEKEEKGSGEEDKDSDAEIDRQLEEIKETEAKVLKKKKRDVLKERKKLRERMSHLGHSSITNVDMSLFDLNTIKSTKDLNNVADADVDENLMDLPDEKNAAEYDEFDLSEDEDDDDELLDPAEAYNDFLNEEDNEEEESDFEDTTESQNPLVTDLGEKTDKNLWFDKDIFKKIEEGTDQAGEVKQAETFYEIISKSAEEKKKQGAAKQKAKEYYSSDSESSDSDYDLDENVIDEDKNKTFPGTNFTKRKLTAGELALGTAIATSKKKKRDIIDDSFHRNTFNDGDLPDWFVDDEKKVNVQEFVEKHVSKAELKYYLAKDLNINVKTIKKVAEAKAKKKKRLQKKREKARKQAETITDSEAMSGAEKAAQIKSIYKKAGLLHKKKESKTYVFASRGTGKRVTRPPGVKGRYVVVDRRMKTDKRGQMKGDKNVKKKLKKGRK